MFFKKENHDHILANENPIQQMLQFAYFKARLTIKFQNRQQSIGQIGPDVKCVIFFYSFPGRGPRGKRSAGRRIVGRGPRVTRASGRRSLRREPPERMSAREDAWARCPSAQDRQARRLRGTIVHSNSTKPRRQVRQFVQGKHVFELTPLLRQTPL